MRCDPCIVLSVLVYALRSCLSVIFGIGVLIQYCGPVVSEVMICCNSCICFGGFAMLLGILFHCFIILLIPSRFC